MNARLRSDEGVRVYERGRTYNRRIDIHAKYGGNAQSGISPCANHPYVFLFTAPAGEKYGYDDGWLSTTQFSYTGEGQLGDMEMARGNRAIQQHVTDNRELHLFEKSARSGQYHYLGQFRYLSHQIRKGTDGEGDDRSQIVFLLELIETVQA
ncbi:MAG: HNH endonuclease [Planctomycetaceae bacterium]|nr:HNH endonuclease [Planctomycetaceae bacterium]